MLTQPEQLMLGMPWIMTQNIEYCLPARLCYVTSALAVEVSANGVSWSALTNANTVGAYTSAARIRCTTGSTTILCKA
jgi:hypothetical protein